MADLESTRHHNTEILSSRDVPPSPPDFESFDINELEQNTVVVAQQTKPNPILSCVGFMNAVVMASKVTTKYVILPGVSIVLLYIVARNWDALVDGNVGTVVNDLSPLTSLLSDPQALEAIKNFIEIFKPLLTTNSDDSMVLGTERFNPQECIKMCLKVPNIM